MGSQRALRPIFALLMVMLWLGPPREPYPHPTLPLGAEEACVHAIRDGIARFFESSITGTHDRGRGMA